MADPNSARIRQTWQRGEQAEFRFSFTNSAGDALTPLDSNKYPSYAFISPSGIQVQSGVAQAQGNPGQYRVLWTIPADADLSNDEMVWQLQVNFVTARRSQLSHTFDFYVVDKQVTSTGKKDIVGLAIEGTPYRLFWRGDFDPQSLTLECYASDWPDIPTRSPIPSTSIVDKSAMTKIIDGDSIVYYYDIPASAFQLWDALDNHFTALWNVRETALSEQQTEYEQFRVIRKNMLRHIQSLRFMVDRFQHRLGTPQYISDGDLCEALKEGLGLFNGWFPFSSYNWTDFPTQCTTYWIMLSMWWMLGSQHMLLGQLAFNFCIDEDSYVATNRGLILAKYLRPGALERDVQRLIADLAYSESRKEALSAVVEARSDLVGKSMPIREVLATAGIEQAQDKQVAALRDYGLSEFITKIDSLPRHDLVTCTEAMIDYIEELLYGTAEVNSDLQYSTKYKLVTPYGLDAPQHVWDLGHREVTRVTTRHGYNLTATKDHPFLVLTSDLDIVDKKLGELAVGDVVAVNKDYSAEPDDWDVNLSFIVDMVERSLGEQSGLAKDCTLPRKMTPALARVLGYITSEGYINPKGMICFCNSDKVLLDDYVKSFTEAFGVAPAFREIQVNPVSGTEIHYYSESFRKVALFLIGCGEKYTVAPEKEIPWSIMAAPKHIAKEFIQAFFEGDGSYTRYNTDSQRDKVFVSFASSSVKLLDQMQQLLLRFGVVSSKHNVTSSPVQQLKLPSSAVEVYASTVGFWHKGSTHFAPTRLYEQIEAYPKFVGDYIRKIFSGANKGWYIDPVTGVRERVRSTLRLNETQSIFDSRCPSQKNLLDYLQHRGDLLAKYKPDDLAKLQRLADLNYQWEEITKIEDNGIANVVDPSFAPVDNQLSNHFVANGLITHNSGQAVTLDYDQTAVVDSAIQRLSEWLNAHMTPAKLMVSRQRTGVGSLGVRTQRAFGGYGRVLRYDSGRGVDSNPGYDGVMNTAVMYGIFL